MGSEIFLELLEFKHCDLIMYFFIYKYTFLKDTIIVSGLFYAL